MKKIGLLKVFLTVVLITLVVLPIMVAEHSWPTLAKEYLFAHAYNETGASNTVSSIYLGYRFMDTLGETLVLLVAVTGTMSILINMERDKGLEHEFSLTPEKRAQNALRTNLLEVIASKLGPIVLLFGFYVMLYGHISPGGGFQGGVIVASAIVFLALGTELKTKLTSSVVLSRIESVAFLSLIVVSLYGSFFSKRVLANPTAVVMALSPNYIIVLNIIIGLKVGTSIAVMCIAMMGGRGDH